MARCYVSVGSNIAREQAVRAGVAALREAFGALQVSSVYESGAVGFAGDPFFNLVVGFDTELDVHTVARHLRGIEDAHGRDRSGPRFSSRTLDLDLLVYDALVLHDDRVAVPRGEITEHAYVLWPLAEIYPEGVHPLTGRTYAALWSELNKTRLDIHPVPFLWLGSMPT